MRCLSFWAGEVRDRTYLGAYVDTLRKEVRQRALGVSHGCDPLTSVVVIEAEV
jgi:hypothetical protein